jgi:hypothetical protein
MTTCINLAERFGGRYRITFDPAYDAKGRHRVNRDPWMMQIPCEGRGVTIYPHGAERLAVEVNYRPSLARALVSLPGVIIHQDGGRRGGEKTFLFPVDLFDQVAALVKPRRRRVLTDEQRQAAAARLPSYRSTPAAQSDLAPIGAAICPSGGSQAAPEEIAISGRPRTQPTLC